MDNGNQPATKHDVSQLRSELQQDIAPLRAETQHRYYDLKETLRDGQTEILKAFYGYAQTTDVKLKQAEAEDILLRQRLTALEGRLLDVEKRLNMPPTQ